MKKMYKIGILILVSIFFWGCTSASPDTRGKIISPKNNLIPIKGKWEIYESLMMKQLSGNNNKNELLGKYAQFSVDAIMIGDSFWKSPNYKTKVVSADDYLFLKNGLTKDNLGIGNDVLVITLTSEETFICEFLKINNNEMIGIIQNDVFKIRKISDKVDKAFTRLAKESYEMQNKEYLEGDKRELKTGVLIGLRYPKKNKKSIEYGYRTLWISSKNKVLNKTYETKDIFFPRKSGFWWLESKRITEENKTEDVLIAYNISKNELVLNSYTLKDKENWIDKDGSLFRKILYVGNDYVSFEINGSGKFTDAKADWEKSRLQLQPVDNIATMKGVKISDIFNSNGVTALENGKNKLLEEFGNKEIQEVIIENNEENFGLTRKMGHWIFNGRFDFVKDKKLSYIDYNINLIPSSEIVYFDDLYLTWTEIKDRVPEAMDAFTSPNKDIALIQTRRKIFIYPMSNGKLGDTPLSVIELKDGETIVMAEWACGSYVVNWGKTFIENKR